MAPIPLASKSALLWGVFQSAKADQETALEVFQWLDNWLWISQVVEKPRSLSGGGEKTRKGKTCEERRWCSQSQGARLPGGSGCPRQDLELLGSLSKCLVEQMLLQEGKPEERRWFIPSHCPSLFHRASPLASLGARRQGSLGTIGNSAPQVRVQGREAENASERKWVNNPYDFSLTFRQLASLSYAPFQHIRQRIIRTCILLLCFVYISASASVFWSL